MHEPSPILLKAKTTLPLLKEAPVARGRLHEALTFGLKGKLTLVSAPAGYGKTTLLSQWAHDRQRVPAWLSLDETDNDHVRFWRYIVRTLAAVVPEPVGQRIFRLAEALPQVSIHTFLDALLNELYSLSEAPAEEIILIVDDYQRIHNERIHDSLSYFIDYLPATAHVLLASRTELPFPTVKWLANGDFHAIDAAQLSFTARETASYFDALPGPKLSDAETERLTLRTEGWITALKLVSISLHAGTPHSRLLDSLEGNHRNVADYLVHEVVSKLPADVYGFLLRTSVLDRMDAVVCNAVTGENGAMLLERLRSLNLFVIPLDDHNRWFRYHHLFAQFLQELAKNAGVWNQANRLAGECFAARGMMEEALGHAAQAEDSVGMRVYLERHIPTVLGKGELATALHWFQRMPAETEISLELSLLRAFVLVLTGNLGQAEQELSRIERACQSIDRNGRWEQLQSGILFVTSNLVFSNGDFGRWFAFSEGILDRILPADPTYYNFNYNTTEPLVRRTALGLKGMLSQDTETIGSLFTGVLQSHGWQESLIHLYVKQSLCEGYYEWNRLEHCRELLAALRKSSAARQTPGLLVPLRITEARIHLAVGRSQLAHDRIDEALSELAGLPSADIHWIDALRAFKARIYMQEERIPLAKKELAALRLNAAAKPAFNQEFPFLTLCRLLGKQRQENEALRLLEQLRPQSEREQLYSSLAEISCLQALLEAQRGQTGAALQYLREALAIGEKFGYVRTFLDEGPAMADLLAAYLTRGGEQAAGSSPDAMHGYVRRLLELFPETHAPIPRLDAQPAERLTARECNLLRLLRQGATNKQIAAGLALSEGTVRIYLSRLYDKLGVSSRTQALMITQELQLLG
ncbi:LuxR C-terminal-related transcriptional regulator [Paenibacillus sacheonensis]|uniref:LuxR family transcriptional regulator n=1 Tax=Paenibacillus sacheonensis TaxID=742054 RepID=A0A7X4YSF5_9BACL|nr:LuxR C-terminal-related transcriptional regulator [Paenibacillus sacheonensis]MBM7567834.1 LuxR family maltose regulon positive regulatory protein [Paenibacillus sacheonensis]NBC70724.1 LuxR family transcriptional regulator [Paenibacillus sacheonensis]